MAQKKYPRTIDEAVDHLLDSLPLKDKVRITKMNELELLELQLSMGVFIKTEFGLLSGNEELQAAGRELAVGEDDYSGDNISSVIIKKLWKRLQKTHVLRLVD